MCGPGSNVPYVSLVLSAVEHWPGVCSVQAGCGGDSVDIVTSRGLNWTLLSAASSRRLPRVFNQGLAQKIVRLLQRARCCPLFYSSPRIFFCSLHPLPGRIRYSFCARAQLTFWRYSTAGLGSIKSAFLSSETWDLNLLPPTMHLRLQIVATASAMPVQRFANAKLINQQVQTTILSSFHQRPPPQLTQPTLSLCGVRRGHPRSLTSPPAPASTLLPLQSRSCLTPPRALRFVLLSQQTRVCCGFHLHHFQSSSIAGSSPTSSACFLTAVTGAQPHTSTCPARCP